MFDDSNTSGVNFNANPPPIQQDDRTVNQTRGENRDRGRFQKLLKAQQEGDLDGEEELAAAAASKGGVAVNTTKAKAGFSLDFGLKDGGKDDLVALINTTVDEKDKIKQGLGSGGKETGAFAASADGKNIAISGVSGPDGGDAGGSGAVKDAESTHRAEMWQMFENLVNSITAMKSDGKTETTVTLNEPNLFKGAVIKIVEFDQAKGQFNIAFQNLSPDAKNMMDMSSNRDNLKKALEERGYMLHIVTTSLELDKPKAPDGQSQPFFQQKGQQQGGGQQQQKERERPQQEEDF